MAKRSATLWIMQLGLFTVLGLFPLYSRPLTCYVRTLAMPNQQRNLTISLGDNLNSRLSQCAI